MFLLGLNPYGLAYTVGLQGAGSARANPAPIGMQGFIDVALDIGVRCIELHDAWLIALDESTLRRLGDEFRDRRITPIVSASVALEATETLESSIECARLLRAPIVRVPLSYVLEGGRAAQGARWKEIGVHAVATLARERPRAEAVGVRLAIENHQDFGSEELVAMAEAAGPHVGLVFDTGNAFSVAEDPVAFARRAGPRICHVHLKDYRAQFTDEGYRLVRCAIGDGSVPFGGIVDVLRRSHASLTASIEPGALEARHIRLLTNEWWTGYPPRDARELAVAIGRLRPRRLRDDEPYETPWERHAFPDEIVNYEMAQVRKSAENCRTWFRGSEVPRVDGPSAS